MKTDKRSDYTSRDAILKLLSDDEVARVATAETAPNLEPGDEYVDLDLPAEGVHHATAKSATPMGRVLPRKAVMAETWGKIVTLLSTPKSGAKHPPS